MRIKTHQQLLFPQHIVVFTSLTPYGRHLPGSACTERAVSSAAPAVFETSYAGMAQTVPASLCGVGCSNFARQSKEEHHV